jgi:hypothetical protein
MDGVPVYWQDFCGITEELQFQHASEHWGLLSIHLRLVWRQGTWWKQAPCNISCSCSLLERNWRQHSRYAEINMLRRPPVEHMCWHEGCGNADWAAKRLYELELFPMWMGQPSERQTLPCTKWPLRGEMFLRKKNVTHRGLVDKMKIYVPPLHIKLGLIKMSVKAMNKQGEGFDCLRQKFPLAARRSERGSFRRSWSKIAFLKPDLKINWMLPTQEPGIRFKTYAAAFWEIKDNKGK